ncbi:MAG: TRAP transporter small permease [Synergistales bacterium]|nr:TRAP transporter small permease [Synergistales bacterium]
MVSERKTGPAARWAKRLERLSAWSAGALLTLNIGTILLGIFCRYVLHSSFIWTEELARFSLLWLVLLAAYGALFHNEHMVVDFVVPRLPDRLQRLAAGFRLLVTVVVLSLMIYMGFRNALGMWSMRTMAMHIPKTVPLLAVPAGLSLLLAGVLLLERRKREEGRDR